MKESIAAVFFVAVYEVFSYLGIFLARWGAFQNLNGIFSFMFVLLYCFLMLASSQRLMGYFLVPRNFGWRKDCQVVCVS